MEYKLYDWACFKKAGDSDLYKEFCQKHGLELVHQLCLPNYCRKLQVMGIRYPDGGWKKSEEIVVTGPIDHIYDIDLHAMEMPSVPNSPPIWWELVNDDEGDLAPGYQDFLEASERKIPILNQVFTIQINLDEWVEIASGSFPQIQINLIDSAYKSEEDCMIFNGQMVIGQFNNYVLMGNGQVGYINWTCMDGNSRNLLQNLSKEAKYHRGRTQRFADVNPFEFIGDITGWRLPCPQYQSFEELESAATR